jgi:hypothetical protein
MTKTGQHPPATRATPRTQVTETQAAQTQLDRAAEDYRRLHAERTALIAQWDEAAAAAARRDEAIAAAGAEFSARRAALRRRKVELDAKAAGLEAEEATQRELEARVAHFEKELVTGTGAGGSAGSMAGRGVAAALRGELWGFGGGVALRTSAKARRAH